jgi:hypothetical protein
MGMDNRIHIVWWAQNGMIYGELELSGWCKILLLGTSSHPSKMLSSPPPPPPAVGNVFGYSEENLVQI